MEYMSQEGYDELVAELQHMVNVELPPCVMLSLRLVTRVTSVKTLNIMLPSVNRVNC